MEIFAILSRNMILTRNSRVAKSITQCALRMPAIALTLAIASMGQTPTPPLPFVGCISYGQADNVEAPQGASVKRSFRSHDAGNLAYYKSAEIGLVAPVGWKCEGYSDSSGWGMFLSPAPIKGESRWPNFKGPAIHLSHISGENGFGRSQIAEAVSRVFPAFRTWATGSMEGFGIDLPRGPYPTDRLNYRSSRVVEFETPPRSKGLSNDYSRIVPNDKSIFGVAILMGNPPEHLLVLSIRLPSELQSLLPLIIRDIEEHRGEN
jgi:hypothetical protein